MLVSELYPCLICGFKGLETSPVYNGEYQKTFDICPCCGFEFGYSEDHDVSLGFIVTPDHLIEAAFQLYRKQWIEGGMKLYFLQLMSRRNIKMIISLHSMLY